MDQIGNYFFKFLTLVENGWNMLNSEVSKRDFKYKETILNHLKNFEIRMKQYNPIVIIICTFIFYYTFFAILKFLRRTWKKISNFNFFEFFS